MNILALVLILVFCLPHHQVLAFGAGNIPSYAYLEGKAFRHGDIEDVLSDLIKHSASGFTLASLISKGSKFNGLDVKRVYFGNWLRDYSQAVDIGGLKRLQLQSIITLCMVLGFLAHGYVTEEFEVTAERLGVYLPVEHIDNPKGYGEGEDARKYHPKLRGPINPMELQIDSRTGMKNYIANEQGNWDTSKAHVRRVLLDCIRYGRVYRSQGRKEDEYEAFRLLGTALHTLEDFAAHSNFCEVALVSMGYREVFTHVGDNVRIQAPNGRRVAPIVTGTFGSSDFTFSLLGEAADHLSEASVTDLNRELGKARTRSQGTRGQPGFDSASSLRELLFSLPGGTADSMSRDMNNIERIRAGAAQGGKRPEDMTPQELQSTLWQVLVFRDSVMKRISQTIEKIPGFDSLVEKISDSISVFVLTTIEPFVRPLLKQTMAGLSTASEEVINKGDQYQVFDDPRASDPTHSFLSKDHFNLILNEPAGEVAKVVVIYTVNLVTKAWDDESINVQGVTEDILSCLFHPDFHNPNSKIQRDMLQCMHTWVEGLKDRQQSVLRRLTKGAVRNHQNIRGLGEGGPATSGGSFAVAEAHNVQQGFLSQAQNIPGLGFAASLLKDEGTKRSNYEYPTAASTGAPTPYYVSEAKYTPGYETESSSKFTSSYVSPPFQSQAYAPPRPPQPYGMPSETSQSGYAPSYAPSYISRPEPPSEPTYPSFPGAEPARHGEHHHHHHTHEGRHESEHGSYEEYNRNEGRHQHDHRHHVGNTGYEYGGRFPEPGSGGFTLPPGSSPSDPSAESYESYSSQAPRFPEERPSSDDSYYYGRRY
ncbi:hypothetical protein AX15_004421 [Amanita polypyramis BW_CC]|nr:hypothetical protein AX15_004421 [Amanita polypyramis BW_CC]